MEDGKEAILYEATTDANGMYTITVPKNSVLTFKFICYYEKQVTATETAAIDVLLVQNPDELNKTLIIY